MCECKKNSEVSDEVMAKRIAEIRKGSAITRAYMAQPELISSNVFDIAYEKWMLDHTSGKTFYDHAKDYLRTLRAIENGELDPTDRDSVYIGNEQRGQFYRRNGRPGCRLCGDYERSFHHLLQYQRHRH